MLWPQYKLFTPKQTNWAQARKGLLKQRQRDEWERKKAIPQQLGHDTEHHVSNI